MLCPNRPLDPDSLPLPLLALLLFLIFLVVFCPFPALIHALAIGLKFFFTDVVLNVEFDLP